MTSSTTHTTTQFRGQILSVILPKPLKITSNNEVKTKKAIKAEVVIAATLILMGINLVIGSQFTSTHQPKTAGTISSGVNEKV